MRRLLWGLMTVLAVAIAAYALAAVFLPSFGAPFIAERRATMPLALYAHLVGGGVALGLGPWQFARGLRARALGVHRWLGRGYVAAVLAGGLGGLVMATRSEEGLVTHVGFGLLAVVWLASTTMAFVKIRRRDRAAHQIWMIRSFALTLAAVTLRIYIPLSQAAGIPFPEAYQVISWLCWVPNLVVAEWLVVPRAAPA
ncbi:MAG: DUF2306 domain-containing protein [Gemmatimonadales bacterium]